MCKVNLSVFLQIKIGAKVGELPGVIALDVNTNEGLPARRNYPPVVALN